MISTSIKKFGLSIVNNIFAFSAKSGDWSRIVSYSNYLGDANPCMFIKKSKYTVLVPLNSSDEGLLMAAKTKTRNQIRRALKDGVVCEESNDMKEFVEYYNAFAKDKGLGVISEQTCIKYGNSLILTKAIKDGTILCYHANLLDDESRRSILLYSASLRLSENINRTLIGNANRLLHYFDFCCLRDKGMNIYDFGGIYTGDKDKAKMGIADFKQSFGGEKAPVYTYYSPLYYMLMILTGK